MSKDSPAKYYQNNNGRLPKKSLRKISKSFYSRKRKKAAILSWTITNVLEEEKQNLLSIEKGILKWEKCLVIIIKKTIILKSNDLESSFDKEYIEDKYPNLHNNKIQKKVSQCICLSAVLIDSFYRKDENYCLQVFRKECKNVFQEKKTSRFINDDIEITSDDSVKDDSDKESSDNENSFENKELFFKKNVRIF